MENNEIYIDGVNVAGCEFFDYECSAYRQEYWESEDNTKDMCSSHPDCYYKQLKRLKKKLDLAVGRSITHGEAAEKYWAALEEIRDTLNKIFNVCDDDCGNASEIAKVVDKINEVLTL